jgi:FtsP/CotA-like multicopper oxidase with cupredoxin domain
VRAFTLTAQVARIDGQEAWTYDGTVPGPELRARQGDRVRVTLVDRLPVSTTIHWHGVPGLPNAEDGVAGVTQQAVAPGHSMTYEFVASAAGTYWYHSHQDTSSQLAHGLYGALVVEPAGGPTEARDYSVVIHYLAGAVMANGSPDLHLAARPGDTVRLRLIDAVSPGMDGGPEVPVLLGAPYRIVSFDGRDLDQPGTLGPERIPLGMGQRADVVFTMPASGAVRLLDTEQMGDVTGVQSAITSLAGGRPRLPVVTIGDGSAPAPEPAASLPVFDPLRYGAPAPDPVAATAPAATHPVVITENPGFRDGSVQLVHEINGRASPDVPPIVVHEGDVVRLHIVNDTGEYHPMHLHGHTMSVLDRDGVPVQGSPIRLDTVLVGPHQTWDVAFLADNPGIWMFHCHVPLHAAFGLTMTIDYAGVTTPYAMGTRSGNMPE